MSSHHSLLIPTEVVPGNPCLSGPRAFQNRAATEVADADTRRSWHLRRGRPKPTSASETYKPLPACLTPEAVSDNPEGLKNNPEGSLVSPPNHREAVGREMCGRAFQPKSELPFPTCRRSGWSSTPRPPSLTPLSMLPSTRREARRGAWTSTFTANCSDRMGASPAV
mgnify:CR=1 FL=1